MPRPRKSRGTRRVIPTTAERASYIPSMASSKLQASLEHVTNEVTSAAASINFDFTLVRSEAPKEYHDLGSALSKKRKDEAELGQTHITARRLGALFDGVCPRTPKLIKAFGLRASEIAAHGKDTVAEPSGSMFAEYSGIDGTSIWAAATSSATAIHIQLLACMLARVWKFHQATSVWYELVEERRREIAGRCEKGEALDLGTRAAAAQAKIPRSHLAEWDASARAWLRTADRVKIGAQQQLMRIISTVDIPVSSDMGVYPSVMAAWKMALETMEKLLGGIPRATDKGPPLLAISSWHLYPDLLVVGEKESLFRFDDPLVSPGGNLTICLDMIDGQGHGVYWSLSLAHVSFYGYPVLGEGQVILSERISFSQFTIAIFGALMGAWSIPPNSIDMAAQLFVALEDFLTRTYQSNASNSDVRGALGKFFYNQSHWWRILTDAARQILEASGAENDEVQKLINLGLRRSSNIFPHDGMIRSRLPFVGLCQPSTIVGLLKGSQERVGFLRSMIARGYSQDNPPHASLVIKTMDTLGDREHLWQASPITQNVRDHTWTGVGRGDMRDDFSTLEKLPPTGELRGYVNLPRPYKGYFVPVKDYSTEDQSTLREIYGNDTYATICQDPSAPEQNIPDPELNDIVWLLSNDQLDPLSLLHYLDRGLDPFESINLTMRALTTAFEIYRSIPSATLNIKVLDKPLSTAPWAKSGNSTALNLFTAFSCVAYMEACVDVSPSSIESVFALAHEDSLYIAKQLVCDPYEQPAAFELRHVLGNVGRPGITLLVPPTMQKLRPVDPSSWRVANTTAFEGSRENHFQSTSLHLSFTEYYVPLHVPGQHNQDSQLFILESCVSVYDSGKWVGDINVLEALSSQKINRTRHSCLCVNIKGFDTEFSPSPELLSAQSWQDILDPPATNFVVQAHGNWVARLAICAMLPQWLRQDGVREIVLCPTSGWCWRCKGRLLKGTVTTESNQYDPSRAVPRAFID